MSLSREFIKGFGGGFKTFSKSISMAVNSALLLIVYIFGVGLTAVVAKFLGKHFLKRKIDHSKNSYWSALDLEKEPLEHYYRQF